MPYCIECGAMHIGSSQGCIHCGGHKFSEAPPKMSRAVMKPQARDPVVQQVKTESEPEWLIQNRLRVLRPKVPPTLAVTSIFSVPVCGLLGYVFASTNEADFIGLGWFLWIYAGIIIGAICGLIMVKKSREKQEDADISRTLSLIVNWGVLILCVGLPIIAR